MKLEKKIRLFVAITLPQSVRNEIERIQTALKKSELCRGRYTRVAQAHLTLVFIGAVDTAELYQIKHALSSISFSMPTAKLGTVGLFQKQGKVRVIYLDIVCQELATLANLVAERLSSWVAKEDRPFVGHATIMRVETVSDTEKLMSLLQNLPLKPYLFPLTSFVLMESQPGPEGHLYHELERYPLLRP